MTLTLAQARLVVQDHLDDTPTSGIDGDRWTAAQVDTGLSFALSQCLDEYVSSGGDRFDEILDTSSNTSGEVDLSTVDPIEIKGISLLQGGTYWPIKSYRLEEKNIIDTTVRTLQIRYVRKFVLPTTTTHKIMGNGATAANSWDAFDHWVCAKAALFCSTKDAEGRPEIKQLAEDLRFSVLSHTKVPKSVPFPARRNWYSQWIGWVWSQNAKKVVLTLRNY